MAEYTPAPKVTGDRFTAPEWTAATNELDEQETHDAAQDVDINANAAAITALTPLIVVADGVTDDGPTINAALKDLANTTPTRRAEIIITALAGRSVFINTPVYLLSDFTTLRFTVPVVFGATGSINIQGAAYETPGLSTRPYLTADVASGATTITVNDATIFSVGDYLTLRGARDASGNSTNKYDGTITAKAGNTLTLATALNSSFAATNTGSPDTHSYVSKVTATKMTASPALGATTLTVADSSIFIAGDFVQLIDDVHTVQPNGSLELNNYKHREVAQVKAILSSTSIRVGHQIHHTYDSATNARVIRLNPVQGSSVRDCSATYSAMSTQNVGFQMSKTVQCMIDNCQIVGSPATGFSWLNHAFKVVDSFGSTVQNSFVRDAVNTTSGGGYGVSLYGATSCAVTNVKGSSCRHTFLFFNGASGNTIADCYSEDAAVSDYDFHGADCNDNLVTNCVAVGGASVAQDGTVNKGAFKVGNPTHTDGDNRNTFSGCVAVNYAGAAFEVVSSSQDSAYLNCRAINVTTGIRLLSNAGNTALLSKNTIVRGCVFQDVATPINVDGTSGTQMVQGLAIEDCEWIRPTAGLSVSNATKVRVRRNVFIDPAMSAAAYAFTGNTVAALSVKNNDFSGGVRGVKLTACPAARVTGNVLHDLAETVVYEDNGGNTGALFRDNDVFGFTPTLVTSGTGPSTGGVVDIAGRYLADTPNGHGLLEWNYPPDDTGSGSGQIMTAGTVYLMKLSCRSGLPFSNVVMQLAASGSGVTAGYIAVFDSAGTRLAVSADLSATFNATAGTKVMPLGSAVTPIAGRDLYIAVLSVGGTPPTWIRSGATGVGAPNVGLLNTAYRYAVNGTGQTTMPTSLTLTSNTGTGAFTYWIGLS